MNPNPVLQMTCFQQRDVDAVPSPPVVPHHLHFCCVIDRTYIQVWEQPNYLKKIYIFGMPIFFGRIREISERNRVEDTVFVQSRR